MSIEDSLRFSSEQIIASMNELHISSHCSWGSSRQAAVLVPLLEKDHQWHLLFTKRTDFLPTHKGQISFPGGKAETGDLNAVATAIRETKEEIGIGSESIRIVGKLKDFLTHYGVSISPVVGILDWPVDLCLSEGEVSRVFTIPLAWFVEDENIEIREYTEPGGQPRPVLYYREYQGDVVWGITAFIIHQLVHTLNE